MRLCCRAEFTPATDLERAPDQGGRLGRASSPALVGRRHRPPSCTLHPVTDSPPLSGCARPPFNREVRCPSQGNRGPEPSAHCQPTPGLHEPCPEAVITPTPKPVPKRKWVSLRAEGTWLLMAQFQASAVSGEKVARLLPHDPRAPRGSPPMKCSPRINSSSRERPSLRGPGTKDQAPPHTASLERLTSRSLLR